MTVEVLRQVDVARCAMDPVTKDSKTLALSLSIEEVSALRRLVDASLQIPQARALSNREQAMSVLTGKPVICDQQAPGNVVKRIHLGTKQKRVRACHWPSLKVDRAKVNARTKERRAQNKPSPFASGRLSKDGRVYLPSRKDQKLLNTLRKGISQQLEMEPEALSIPKAVVSCIEEDDELARPVHTQTGVCVQISCSSGCNKVEVVQSTGAGQPTGGSMRAGEALVFDASVGYRMPVGHLQGNLFFTAKGDPL